jgi:1-acyl-sn-glycerol-3-phosphate acyltransferase
VPLVDASDPLRQPRRAAIALVRSSGIAWVRRYHRLSIDVAASVYPSRPVLFVANHGFGAVADVNVYATLAAIDEMHRDRPLTPLAHEFAWWLRLGRLFEEAGAVTASRTNAFDALHRGSDVLVFPGGDIEATKPWSQRHRVLFSGRSGFAAVAITTGAPIVPIVTAGAGNTAVVLSNGRVLARLLGVDRLARQKTLPISIAAPYGLSIGLAGMLPYLPFPARLRTAVLAPIRPDPADDPQEVAQRTEQLMQAAMDRLVQA